MRRREFIAALGVTALAWPVGALGQASGNKKLIAWLSGTTPNIGSVYLDSFLQGMRDLGYVEGANSTWSLVSRAAIRINGEITRIPNFALFRSS